MARDEVAEIEGFPATSGAPDRAQGLALPSQAPATLGRLGLVGGCSPNELQSPSAGMASEHPPHPVGSWAPAALTTRRHFPFSFG